MKTAMKLSKKELLSIYEKSNDMVKKNLRAEFPELLSMQAEAKPVTNVGAVRIPKSKNTTKRKWLIDWEMILDFSPALRIAVYAFLLCIIFS